MPKNSIVLKIPSKETYKCKGLMFTKNVAVIGKGKIWNFITRKISAFSVLFEDVPTSKAT